MPGHLIMTFRRFAMTCVAGRLKAVGARSPVRSNSLDNTSSNRCPQLPEPSWLCMERANYPKIIQDILSRHTGKDLETQTEVQLLFDADRHHYQVLHLGWVEEAQVRVHACIVHVDLKDDKIWIQRDGTEIGIANELVEAGVPKHDIVLGFHGPYKRPFTGFAIG